MAPAVYQAALTKPGRSAVPLTALTNGASRFAKKRPKPSLSRAHLQAA